LNGMGLSVWHASILHLVQLRDTRKRLNQCTYTIIV
jgi:hypothetical protein